MSAIKTNSGSSLNREWNVGARHALYHKDGKWFMPLDKFPGALFDPKGYVLFKSMEDLINCKHLSVGERINVPCGISHLPNYIKVR